MFDEWLASDLRDYYGDMITVETDIKQLPAVKGRLVTVQPAYLSLAVDDCLIVLRAERVLALRLPNRVDDKPEETTQP